MVHGDLVSTVASHQAAVTNFSKSRAVTTLYGLLSTDDSGIGQSYTHLLFMHLPFFLCIKNDRFVCLCIITSIQQNNTQQQDIHAPLKHRRHKATCGSIAATSTNMQERQGQ